MKRKWLFSLALAVMILLLTACGFSKQSNAVDIILDWTPNTNHTGLYVALEKGYFEEEGVSVALKLPSEDSSSDLVINGQAPFAVYFQDAMAKKLEKGAGITAVAALVEHNTSGIISRKEAGIKTPADLVGNRYGSWNDPIELAMLESLLDDAGKTSDQANLVPNVDANSITPMENDLFDAAWIYYGWDGIMAEEQSLEMDFFYLTDFEPAFDYYSPVLIASNDYLEKNPEEAKKVLRAIKRGYQYAIENPEESAEILIKHVPSLKSQENFVKASQAYLSNQYAKDSDRWGEIDPGRWNAFYNWAYEKGILESNLENIGFSNEYLN